MSQPLEGLRRRAMRSAIVTVFGHGAGQAFRMVSNLVLTRLLAPEAFGVMAIVYLVINGLTLISDVGIRPAIIRHERGDDPEFLDTAWTLSVVRGFGLWFVACALAVPLSVLYGAPELRALIPASAVISAIAGFESTKLVALIRKLTLERRVAIDLLSQLVAFAVMVALAYAMPSVWALVAGAIAAGLTRLLLSFVALPGRGNRFRWNRAAARDIQGFGKWILVSSLFTFLSMRMDVILLGRLVPLDVLGVYSIAITVAVVQRDVLGRVISSVLMPVLSAANLDGFASFLAKFARSQEILLRGGLLAVLASAVISPAFFHYLYDERYAEAGWISQLSMVSLWFFYLQSCAARASEALGDSRSVAASEATKTLATAGGCAGGWMLAGMPGLILGAAAGTLASYALSAYALRARGVPVLAADLRYTLIGVALAAASCALPREIGAWLLPERSAALVTLLFGSLMLAPYAFWTVRLVWAESRHA